jgi:hypothetical protein
METTTERPTVWQLARMAECSDPDANDSAGARFLDSVYDSTMEALAYGPVDQEEVFEIADAAPDVYTCQRWQEFVDLAAWQEDTSELGRGDDMTQEAGIALYLIAERLAWAIVNDHQDNASDDDYR